MYFNNLVFYIRTEYSFLVVMSRDNRMVTGLNYRVEIV